MVIIHNIKVLRQSKKTEIFFFFRNLCKTKVWPIKQNYIKQSVLLKQDNAKQQKMYTKQTYRYKTKLKKCYCLAASDKMHKARKQKIINETMSSTKNWSSYK